MKLSDWLKTQTDLMLEDRAYVITAVICALAIIGILITGLIR